MHRQLLPLLLLLGACAAPPRDTVVGRMPDPPAHVLAAADSTAAASREAGLVSKDPIQAVLEMAESLVGTPYRYGGSGLGGLDCSGLVLRSYGAAELTLPRTSAQQYKVGREVPHADLSRGDLVFFADSSGRVHHVGIFVGDGRFVHASSSRRVVRHDYLDRGYFRKHYVGARRVIGSS